MSKRSEIRAALADGPKDADELLPLCPSFEGDRAALSTNLSVLASENKLRRAGLSENQRALYAIDVWPKSDEAASPASGSKRPSKTKAAPPPPRKNQPKKMPRKPKAPRSPAALVPVAPAEETHIVALRPNGAIFILDKTEGTYNELPPSVALQLRDLFALGNRPTPT